MALEQSAWCRYYRDYRDYRHYRHYRRYRHYRHYTNYMLGSTRTAGTGGLWRGRRR